MARPSSRARASLPAAIALLVLLGGARVAAAHGMRSGYVELVEADPGIATMRLRTTVDAPDFAANVVGCRPDALPGATVGDSGATRTFVLHCDGPLGGRTLDVSGFGPLEEVSVLARTADGETAAVVLMPDAPSLVLPSRQGALDVAARYVGLGLRHIATGADHLLFLLLLVLHLRRWRPVLAAETAFSISHGLAYAATALGWVHVAPAPVEACIALSLLLLALDVKETPPEGATARAALLALTFGVVHGLGFAGGLREAGLPDHHAAVALLGFGLGVEVGQIAAVVVVLLGLHLLRPPAIARWTERGLVTVAGSLAAYWLIARLVAVFAPEMPS